LVECQGEAEDGRGPEEQEAQEGREGQDAGEVFHGRRGLREMV
jgi:hypothetical protein